MATGYVGYHTGGGIDGRTTDTRGFYFEKVENGKVYNHGWYTYYNMRCSALGNACDTNGRGVYQDNYYAKGGDYYYWPDSDTPTSKKGTIQALDYFKISTSVSTTGSSSDGGTLKGGGTYWADAPSCTLTATPFAGYVLKGFTGYSGTLPTKKEVTQTFTATSDQTYTAEFQKVYNIVYDANGGDADSVPTDTVDHYYNSGTSADILTIPTTTPTRAGYTFLGWSKSKTGAVQYSVGRSYSNLTSDNSITLYAVWTQYTLTFDANGGSPTPSELKGGAGESVMLPAVSSVTKSGYVLSKWTINGVNYNPNSYYTLTNQNLTATAVWRRPTIYITNSDTAKGTLTLYRESITDTNLVTRETGGVLMADVENGDYVVYAKSTNKLYASSGMGASGTAIDHGSIVDADGNATILLTLNGSYTGSVFYAKRTTHTVTVVVHAMAADGVSEVTPPLGMSASVTSPSEPDEGTNAYLAGRAITITGVPTAGYRMTTANVGGDVYTIAEGNAFTILSLDADAVAHCYFTKIPYTLNVTKDAASTAVITGVTVAGGSTKRDATYGDAVEFSATLTNAAGYQFDGWYDGATRVSTANPYTHTVTGDITLTAKAQAKVAFHVAPRDNRTTPSPEATPGTCSVTPSAETYVTLGESVDYALTLGAIYEGSAANWLFNAWFATTDTGRTNPLQMAQGGTLAVTVPIDVTADVTSVALTNVVTITVRNDENETVIANASAITAYPAPDSGGWDAANNRYALTFVGTKSVRLTAKDSIAVGTNTLAFSGYKVGTAEIHANPQYTFLANGNLSITAYYGSAGNRKITLAYAVKGGTRGDRTMGKFAISAMTDPDGTISADGHTATVARGSKLTIVAEPMNGYRFGGWYAQETVGGTAKFADAAFDLTVGTELALFAYFEQDPNAVYEWEGSANNKSFTWRSKTYVAGKPFNPACCRVDTEGYPLVSLQVDMFSAPDTAPTARVELDNVASQTARRLPVRRPERYLQVCVQNSYEVDAVFIGTNMTELAQ